jgi:hypothetical protein
MDGYIYVTIVSIQHQMTLSQDNCIMITKVTDRSDDGAEAQL